MKKPELLVIPVTQSNVSEIQCLPLQMASNNTPPIVNALDEQNTNNTRSFTSDEQEIVSFFLSKHFLLKFSEI